MSEPTLKDILSNMQVVLAKKLLDKLENGEWTAADANVARQLLKDNKIEAGTPKANPAMLRLAENLPFDDEEVA